MLYPRHRAAEKLGKQIKTPAFGGQARIHFSLGPTGGVDQKGSRWRAGHVIRDDSISVLYPRHSGKPETVLGKYINPDIRLSYTRRITLGPTRGADSSAGLTQVIWTWDCDSWLVRLPTDIMEQVLDGHPFREA